MPVVGHFHSLPEVRFYFERDLEKKTVGEFIWKPVKYFYQACDITISPTEEIRKFKLLLVGEGSRKKEILQKIKESNLSGRVSIYDPVPNSGLVKFYNACDIYVNASVSETLGFSMIEAMACELPVVAASSPGAREIIQDGRNGYLAEPNSPESIAEKIPLESEKRRAMFSRMSRKLAEEKYDINKVCERLIKVYEFIT